MLKISHYYITTILLVIITTITYSNVADNIHQQMAFPSWSVASCAQHLVQANGLKASESICAILLKPAYLTPQLVFILKTARTHRLRLHRYTSVQDRMHSTLLLRDTPKVPFQTVPALSHSLKVNCQVQTHSARKHKVEEEEVVDLSSLCEDFLRIFHHSFPARA